MSTERVYLDHAATAPLLPEVREAIAELFASVAANPSSVHAEGRRARAAIDRAREEVALFAGCQAAEIVFTSGGSESNALAILGALDTARDPAAPLVVSAVEHPSVGKLVERIEKHGRPLARLGVDRNGHLDREHLEGLLAAERCPALVSVMSANNETGTRFPVEELARLCREASVPFHTDAVQAAGKIETPVAACGADLVSFSGHKLGAPPGIGALVVRRGTECAATLGAGAQEHGLRGGTENVPGIVALGVAAGWWRRNGPAVRTRLADLGKELEDWIGEIPGAFVVAAESPRLPSTLTICFSGRSGEAILQALDLEGIAVSVGAACASGSLEPSPTLLAMGFSREEAKASVRVSLGWSTTAEDVEKLKQSLPAVLDRVARAAGRRGRAG